MSHDLAGGLSPTTPVVRRDGSTATPLWEQTHFVLAVRDVFLACRAPDDATAWQLVQQSLTHASLEGRARWMLVLGVDPDTGEVTGTAASGLSDRDRLGDASGRVRAPDPSDVRGHRVDALGVPEATLLPPRTVHRCGSEDTTGVIARFRGADEHVACVPLFGGVDLVGLLVVGIQERAGRPDVWMNVYADLLAWSMKGRRHGGARPGMGLPSMNEVADTAPDAAWMAIALELSGDAIGVSAFPGQMSYVTAAGRASMSVSGVDDYATDIDGIPGQDVDEMAWRAQTMVAAIADPEGAGRRIVRIVPDGAGGEIAIRFEARLVRHHRTGSIDRAVMLITPLAAGATDDEEIAPEPTRRRPAAHDATAPVAGETDAATERTSRASSSLASSSSPVVHRLEDDLTGDVGSSGPLSRRQREVALRLLSGDRPVMIASDLGLSVHTVRGHISALYRHTRARDVNQLLATLRRELT
jgi:DNA-binding CsgD family transcriptional regulator